MESGGATGQRYDDVGRVADACPPMRGRTPWGMLPLNLTQLAIGERVQHELLVVERVEKTQGNGDQYVLLTLGNASGSISVAPIWSSQRQWADGADRGRVVQAIGQVGLYQKTGKRQIHLTGPLRVVPAEQVDPARLPSAHRRRNDPAVGLDRQATRRDGDGDAPSGRGSVLRRRRLPPPAGADPRLGERPSREARRAAAARVRGHVDRPEHGHDDEREHGPCRRRRAPARRGKSRRTTSKAGASARRQPGCCSVTSCWGASCSSGGWPRRAGRSVRRASSRSPAHDPVASRRARVRKPRAADDRRGGDRPLGEASAKANDMIESLEDSEAFATGKEFSDKRPWRVGRRIWRRPDGVWAS